VSHELIHGPSEQLPLRGGYPAQEQPRRVHTGEVQELADLLHPLLGINVSHAVMAIARMAT
jgi:hypothetical protein